MNIKDLADQSEDIQRQVKNGGKTSSSSSAYPKTEERIPRLSVYEKNGELVFGVDAQDDVAVVYEKKKKNSRWKKKYQTENLERYWMTDQDVAYTKWLVKAELDMDLFTLLNESPRNALRAIDKAANQHGRNDQPSMYRNCPVCGEDLHIITGDWVKINHRRVCDDHTTKELVDSGLM